MRSVSLHNASWRLYKGENTITESKPNRIVIVDDDEAVRDSLSLVLSLSGFDAHSFASGIELQKAVPNQQIDCLIVDVNMPGMSGLDLVKWLNENSYEIPIILISAKLDCAIERRAKRLGITQFLEKPFSDMRLIEAIRTLLQ